MGTILAGLLAQFAVSILKAYWARQDIHDAERWKLYQQMDAINTAAFAWKAEAFADAARASRLRVSADAQGLRPGGPGADAPGSSGGDPVP